MVFSRMSRQAWKVYCRVFCKSNRYCRKGECK